MEDEEKTVFPAAVCREPGGASAGRLLCKAYLLVNTVLKAADLLDDTAHEKLQAFNKRELEF